MSSKVQQIPGYGENIVLSLFRALQLDSRNHIENIQFVGSKNQQIDMVVIFDIDAKTVGARNIQVKANCNQLERYDVNTDSSTKPFKYYLSNVTDFLSMHCTDDESTKTTYCKLRIVPKSFWNKEFVKTLCPKASVELVSTHFNLSTKTFSMTNPYVAGWKILVDY